MRNCEQVDGKNGGAYRRYIKRRKNRIERRRAKLDPDTQPAYRRYYGWEI